VPLLLAISLLSAAVIGYEILLMRLFSIVQWHHFAYMIISLALLGYGASGTFIALARGWLLPRFRVVFAAFAAGFGVTAVGGFLIAQQVDFNPLEVLWDAGQPLRLLAIYLVLAVPFFCAASCVGLTFARFGGRTSVIYCSDLVGAGVGALAIILALFAFRPMTGLALLGGIGIAAAGLSLLEAGKGRWIGAGLVALGLASSFLWPERSLELRSSPYKALAQALQVPGAKIIGERSSPLGLLSVVESRKTPLRYAPGLSLRATQKIPPQIGVFVDGDAMSAITRYKGRRRSLAYLDWQTAALPYHLTKRPHVLILGAGTGSDVLLALYHGARRIEAVELNPQIVDLVRRSYAGFAGGIYGLPQVEVHVAEARGFVGRSRQHYDLIQLALLDSFSTSAAGLHALSESALYTVEALSLYLRRLAPGGTLAITRWVKLPPRDSLKMAATAIVALERSGVREVGRHIVVVRGWNTATLLVRQSPFDDAGIAAVKAFARARGFDLAYYPGMPRHEANRHNVLPQPYIYEGVTRLLGKQRDAYLTAYRFNIAAATDDRPYFFHFFKWGLLPELLSAPAAAVSIVEWGYLVLVATLVQAVVVSLLLILAPLRRLRRRVSDAAGGRLFARVFIYFSALGAAFMFIEMSFIQRFVLFLSHPLFAVSVVLCAFLVFAGLGSALSVRLAALAGGTRGTGFVRLFPVWPAVVGIVAIGTLYAVTLPLVFEALMSAPEGIRIAVSVGLIAPLAFFMGMPFPLGLREVSEAAPRLVPWAWAINGCASVTSTVLATLLAIHFGFTVLIGLAVVFYLLAAVGFPGSIGPSRSRSRSAPNGLSPKTSHPGPIQ
jgi:spermidine synthase